MPIAVRHHGTAGPMVVVLHGGPGAPGSALGLARVLAPSFRVLEPLQRRADGVPLTVERHVDDLADVAPPAAVVGFSWGAMLGLSYAVRHPERVTALVLVGCGTYSDDERRLYRARIGARLGPLGRRRRDEIRDAIDRTVDPGSRDRLFGEYGRLLGDAQHVEVCEAAGDDLLDIDRQGNRETWEDALRRQADGREPAAFAAIRLPVLMLHGEDDPHPGEATRDTLRRFVPQLEYVSFARCGHEPWRERHAHAEFERVLVDWLARRTGLAGYMPSSSMPSSSSSSP